jgi:ADP-ribose pyrophosphatase
MNTIIVGDGLTENFLNSETPYIACNENVGRNEIDRLMGRGRNFGKGPLPTFLRQAIGASNKGADIGILFLRSPGEPNNRAGVIPSAPEPQEFTESLREIATDARVVDIPPGLAPWDRISEGMQRLTGYSFQQLEKNRHKIRFLVLGCHTEKRILIISTFLRNVLCFNHVAVSSHLMASSTQEAHFATLRHTFPINDIRVILSLEETAEYVGISSEGLIDFGLKPCTIEPEVARKALGKEQRRIIELLCMHWSRTSLRPLQGGFSGSLLFLADGWKLDAYTEPMVLKIDSLEQMRREIDGYYQVKDLLGKHIPSFGYPVVQDAFMGIAMELAAMDGQPETLQDNFEGAENEEMHNTFMYRLEKALDIMSRRLYRNTIKSSVVSPYRDFSLHTEKQGKRLEENVAVIMEYLAAEKRPTININSKIIPKILKLIAANEDGVESEICLAHGDFNFQNIICDRGGNVWFIDWTHCGYHPFEIDFAKLENDVKFVMSKHFDMDDLPRLRQFEEYLISERLPAENSNLPEHLKFVRWDLRFRKILEAVRKIREECFAERNEGPWLVYRIALLKYAVHTLSFDKRRNQGECELSQLTHALFSVNKLLLDLISDDFHLKIRGERPLSYPPRHRVLIDQSPWKIECLEYSPPYHVDPSVLDNDYTRKPDGWADPEDFNDFPSKARLTRFKHTDNEGRPINPRGRTGIAGRGLLGRWGPNLAITAIVLRGDPISDGMEILIGEREKDQILSLPKGFVLPEEGPEAAVTRVLEKECGWHPDSEGLHQISEGYSYDPRQTDHAWVEMRAFLYRDETDAAPDLFLPGREFEKVSWRLMDSKTINRVRPEQANIIRDVIKHLQTKGILDMESVEVMLSGT